MKFRKNGDRMEIKIRNVDPVVVTKLDELARKQHLSRNEYLKKIVSRCAVVQDVIDLDKKYADLVNVLAERLEQATDVIATNTEILEKIIGGH
jgi:hypothetical protein